MDLQTIGYAILGVIVIVGVVEAIRLHNENTQYELTVTILPSDKDNLKALYKSTKSLLEQYIYLYENFDPEGTHAVWAEWQWNVETDLKLIEEAHPSWVKEEVKYE